MSIASRGRLATAAIAFALLGVPSASPAQPSASDTPYFTARYAPHLRFRTLTTRRFSIHYHQQEEALAQRLARIAEQVATEMEPRFGATRQRVHVILVDQTDQSNGWATVIPYNLIEITTAPPRGQSAIGNTDDWMRLVFTHEYAHVVHLEKSGGLLGGLRHVFGRIPLFYPNLFLPAWQIEGIATFEESAQTGQGRVRASDFRMMLDRAAAAGRYAPLDRANGGVIDWPSGHVPYLYGGFFHQCLADRYGRESHARLAEATARRLPFLGSRAFREVYGKSLRELWDECRTATTTRAGAETERPMRLTTHGFIVTSPAFSRDGRLFYSVANPHGFPALMEFRGGASEPRAVTSRYRGERLAAAGDRLLFDQLEVVSEIDVQSDIYSVAMDGGGLRRLTREARAADPDAAPDGTIVCTIQQADRRLLATFRAPADGSYAQPQPIVSEPSAEFTSPRWSADGRAIVAERRRLGGPSEIVVVDAATKEVKPIVATPDARNVSPMWLPDGSILFASTRASQPFTLYAVDVNGGRLRRLRGAGEGAHSPALSPDGRRLVFVGYSADGDDLYSIPFDTAAWDLLDPTSLASDAGAARTGGAGTPPAAAATITPDGTYQPWATLTPRFWTPILEASDDDVLVGGATGGYDALGRHGYGVVAAWAFERGRPEWQIDYTYARWRPALFVSASDETDAFRSGDVRAREMNAGVLFPWRRVRWTSSTMAAFHAAEETYRCAACEPAIDGTRQRGALRFGWNVSNAKSFGYSISAEEGGAVTLTSEWTRRGLGADGNAASVTAEARGYLRALPRHGVLAVRGAAATAWGDGPMRRIFSAAGAGPQGGGFDFGVGAVGLLRGVEESDLVGHHAFVVNADYRFPIAWVQRGIGTLPFLLRSLHGAAFVDMGHAWDTTFRASDLTRSVGAEMSFDVVLGFSFPVTISSGVAWRHDGRDDRHGTVVFGRIGRAF